MNQLNTIEEFDQVIQKEKAVFVLKHSTTCPISQAAYGEYEKFTRENNEIPAYVLIVQDARPLSNHIAEKYQIKHESPQAILFSENNVIWNASHWKITNKLLAETVEENK
ncbi:bacillithiol system redox-active protein YtxJ [Bacillus sp. V3B]|uniref:bacillithiol system redox-active protein YtxJ n=1 Tax=Bacillus sp. V3B TaxID=2804915 RepID=UPI00210B65A4|nr:bacillithiol system redox-active protein YtxJ [Bacillus sp. V3B]MCQ6274418.1 bacillithiol system redox-active protein YtxJ [Bacillus sp. V3B]